MRKVFSVSVWMAAIALTLSVSYGAESAFVLDEKAIEKLTPQAARLCALAAKRLDRVDYVGAVNYYAIAQEADPGSVELRFIVGKLATREAGKRMGNDSRELLLKAQKAYQQIVDMKDKGLPVRRAEVRRANEALKRVNQLINGQEERDQRRSRVGKEMVDNYVEEIEAAKPPPQAKTGSEMKGRRAAGARPGARGGAGAFAGDEY